MKNKNKQTKKRQKRNQKEYCSCDQLYTLVRWYTVIKQQTL